VLFFLPFLLYSFSIPLLPISLSPCILFSFSYSQIPFFSFPIIIIVIIIIIITFTVSFLLRFPRCIQDHFLCTSDAVQQTMNIHNSVCMNTRTFSASSSRFLLLFVVFSFTIISLDLSTFSHHTQLLNRCQ